MHIDGNLDLLGSTGLTSLPDGLRVGGYLYLRGCTGLLSLPDGLHVGGVVGLEGCSGLTSLPDGLLVDGDLNGCTGLTSLPDGLHVKGDLDIDGCSSLTLLPKDLHVSGSLDLSGSPDITLPDGLYVGDFLNLAESTGLASLPASLHVGRYLSLRFCTNLTSLPGGMRVDGDLDLWGCTGLTSLPDGLQVGGFLKLAVCTGLTTLPDGLSVGGDLRLDDCTGLTSLPDDFHLGGRLHLNNCTGLTSLPGGLCVGASFYLSACTGLTSLPDGLCVDGRLIISGCTGLTSLPGGLHVDGSLDLARCTGLASLPDDLNVGRYLNLEDCTGLTTLPASVLEWGVGSDGEPHDIYLAGSGLPPDELARLQTLGNPALRFHVSMDETFGGAGFGADNFLTLDAAAAFWAKEAQHGETELVISPFVEAAYVRGVLGFLSKLRRAKEFSNSLAKVGLASRVVQMLELLIGEDKGVREELQVRMADAVDTCSDKPMWALNQMQVLVHIVEARGDRTKLRVLGMGVMRLEVVHRHVRKAMDAMRFVDDVCVYLRFEIALRESLQLPVSALEMLYPSFITVTKESIDAAEAEALALTNEDLEAWLPAWSEWQRQDRVDFAEKLDFSALKSHSTNTASANVHSMLGNEVTDPVRLEPLSTVWSLQDLMTHWINTGMDLNNTPRDVDYMRLNLTKCI